MGSAMERDFNIMVIGSILIVAGVLALLFGSVGNDPWWRMFDMGSLYAASAQRHIAFLPMVGGGVLVGGLVLFAVPRRQRA
jgi:hypothetical protein